MPNANQMKFLGLDDFEVSSGYAEFKVECCNCKKVQEIKGFYPNVNIKKEVVAKMTCSDCDKVDDFLLSLADQSKNCINVRKTVTLYIADSTNEKSGTAGVTYYLQPNIGKWDRKEEFYLPNGWDFFRPQGGRFDYLYTHHSKVKTGKDINFDSVLGCPVMHLLDESGDSFVQVFEKVITVKKLSFTSYGLDMHSHWMEEAELSRCTKAKMTNLASPLVIGYRAKQSLRDFMESQEYNDAQHACDVASGEYPRLLESVAKGLFVASGFIEAGNFQCYLSPPNKEVMPEYFKSEKIFYAKDRQGNGFSVTLDQVERYFHLISNEVV